MIRLKYLSSSEKDRAVVSPSHKITSGAPGMVQHLAVILLLLIQAMHYLFQCLVTCVNGGGRKSRRAHCTCTPGCV